MAQVVALVPLTAPPAGRARLASFMIEHEQGEQSDGHWAAYVSRLSDQEHRQLMVALGSGLQEARKAAQVAADNGLVSDARESLDLAIAWLSEARQALER